MRIAILTHSTNPRGGVVHALALGEALERLGHEAVVHAPDPKGMGFFRKPACGTATFAADPAPGDIAGMVRQRIAEYARYFEGARRFDAYLAGDGISGNALAGLKARGAIHGFARTIHHIDAFDDPALTLLQAQSIAAADRHLAVSRLWQDRLARDWGIAAELVGNGVDTARFTPAISGHERALARRLGIAGGPVLLAVGGVEPRKNTLAILDAFAALRRREPGAQLVIAGGASVLDHSNYQARFAQNLAQSGLPEDAVRLLGPVADADMPDLYRLADMLVFPSLTEGFGLVVLEAMASGVPVVTSRIPPFTEYLGAEDVAWCDPQSPTSIVQAMSRTLVERGDLIWRGLDVAGCHGWDDVARAYLAVFDDLCRSRPLHA